VLALALPAIVFGSALPPTGTSTHQFEFDGNLQVQGSTTGSCTSQPGDLDWSPSTVLSGAGTGNVNCGGTDAAVIKDVARTIPTGNNRSDCTATSANSSLYKPADPNVTPIAPLAPFVLGDGSAGQGVIVCDGTISKQTPSDTNGYVQGGHEDQGQNPVQWNISPASAPKKTDLSEVYTYGMIYKSPFDTVTPTVADNLLMIFDAGRLDTNGDFHVDFELNQKKINDCNDAATDAKLSTVCQPRTPGDVLVSYDSAGGGQPPKATVYEWEHPPTTGAKCESSQGTDASLTDGGCYVLLTTPPSALGGTYPAAAGVFNSAEIPAAPWRAVVCDNTSIQNSSQCTLRDVVAPNGNMEGYIDITAFVNDFNLCPGFGEITARSRSSSGINASLQDTTGAIPVNASVCGSLIVKKADSAGAALPGAKFTFSPDPLTREANSSSEIADGGALDQADANNGYVCIDHVLFGSYDITETGVPTGYFGSNSTLTRTVSSPSTCKDRLDADGVPIGPPDATFTNNLGSLVIKKLQRNADGTTSPLAGATFTVSPDPSVSSPGTNKDFTDGGAGDASTAGGIVCIDNVRNLGSGNDYTITEKTPPSGFFGDSSSIKQGVHSPSSCADRLNADGTLKDPQPVGVSTTLAAASSVGATNIKVASVAGMFAGQTLVIDTGVNQESGVISAVGTSGSGGTGVTLTAASALTKTHASGVAVISSAVASFTNVKGSLVIKKVAKDKSCTEAGFRGLVAAPDCVAVGRALFTGAEFTISPSPVSGTLNSSLDVTDIADGTIGTNDAYNSQGGVICIDNVVNLTSVSGQTATSYSVSEKSAHNTNYAKDTNTYTKTNATLSKDTCATRSTNASGAANVTPDVTTFVNTPRSKIEVLFTSSAGTGVTSAVITCKDEANSTITPDAGGTTGIDQSYSGLLPNSDASHNYTCTVNVDP